MDGISLTQGELQAKFFEMARNFKPFERSDDFRSPKAAKEGGFALDDEAMLSKYRSAFKDLIS